MSGVFNKIASADPLSHFNSRIDPLGNVIGIYGSKAGTPLDPIALKMGAYGYDKTPQDTSQRDAAIAAQQTQPSTSAQLTTADQVSTNNPKRTSSVLFGQ